MEQLNNKFIAVMAFSKHSPDYEYVRFSVPDTITDEQDAEAFVRAEAEANNMQFIAVESA
jgi:hypothetical protein